ncbi:hypothetical protein FRC12_013582 [Ceratobasidium sp. 428]|nr:hypothetical protein FRC12_013582 [Ceratobasidium sp. 428]
MLRGKRNSLQATSADFPAELSKARRAASHYQTYSARPTPQRQATAPLPTRRLTKTRSPRPNLKNVATYSISSPIMSNAEATYKYCELIDPAELTARASQFLAPRESLVRSPSPSHYSDLESKPVSSRRFASSHSVDRTSADEHSDSATETPHTYHGATLGRGFRPKSDVFPLSITESSVRSQVETGCSTGTLATFSGYESRETFSDSHAPFEYDDPTPAESQNIANMFTIQGLGFGVSETMMAISNAGMLHNSTSYGLNEAAIRGSIPNLGDMFSDATSEEDEAELVQGNDAGYSAALAWLGLAGDSTILGRDQVSRPLHTHTSDILDAYLGFGEDAPNLPSCTRERCGPPAATIRPPVPEAAGGSSRPIGMAQCLELMTAGRFEHLLTPWRARLDLTCNFVLLSTDGRRSVQVVEDNHPVAEQSGIVGTILDPVSPNPVVHSRMPRSRSKTLLAAPVSIRPSAPIRRSNSSHAGQITSPGRLSPGVWKLVSGSSTSNLLPTLDSHSVASSSRTPDIRVTTEPTTAQSDAKKRRNTRDMYLESQVAYMMKGSRGTGGSSRGRYRAPVPHKSLEPPRSLKRIDTENLSRAEDEENSAEWIAVSPTQAGPSHPLPKSTAQRSLYAPPKGSRPSARMTKSPSARSGMVKSPSVRSGLAKSGQRRGLSASQSRTSLHASPSQSRIGARNCMYGSPPRGGRFPKSPSTRSLPRSPENVPGDRSRPPRSGARPSKAERRRPGFWDGAGKENVPAATSNEKHKDVDRPESPLRGAPANALCLDLQSPGSDDYQTACSHTPSVSAPVSPRRRKQGESDMMCAPAKTLVVGSPTALRPSAPIVPPRSPARPRTYNRI